MTNLLRIVNDTTDLDPDAPRFVPWPKTPRLFRSILITEKIDGTNGAIIVTNDGRVAAQSRNRLVTPGKDTDNYGFARWVHENAGALRDALGVGYHYGEWYGSGIGRGYGLTGGEKRFALFNVNRYEKNPHINDVDGLEIVPVLGRIDGLDTDSIRGRLAALDLNGSTAVPGFMRPEGIIVYFTASDQVYKVLIENDHVAKTAIPVATGQVPVAA